MQKKIRGIVHENDKNKRMSHVQNEMKKLTHHDEKELLSVWEGWHWDDNTGGWLDPELCAKAKREEVEYIRRHTMYTRVSREKCLRETVKAPIKTGWAETDTGQPRKSNVRSREGIQDAREARVVRVDAAAGGAESGAMGGTWRKGCAIAKGRTSSLPHEEKVFVELPSEDYQARMNTCAGCCNTVCTARATLHKIGKKCSHRHSAISS